MIQSVCVDHVSGERVLSHDEVVYAALAGDREAMRAIDSTQPFVKRFRPDKIHVTVRGVTFESEKFFRRYPRATVGGLFYGCAIYQIAFDRVADGAGALPPMVQNEGDYLAALSAWAGLSVMEKAE